MLRMSWQEDSAVIPRQKTDEKVSAVEAALGRVIVGHSAQVLSNFPDSSIDLIVTSPPYWTAVEYEGQKDPWGSYEEYLTDIMSVWMQCARVLRPNGKLCINTPIMPIPKQVIQQHTRHLKNIAFDFESLILRDTDLLRYSWPAPGFEDTELGVLMGPEVRHGEAEVYTRVQA
jgi:hypothetical protein